MGQRNVRGMIGGLQQGSPNDRYSIVHTLEDTPLKDRGSSCSKILCCCYCYCSETFGEVFLIFTTLLLLLIIIIKIKTTTIKTTTIIITAITIIIMMMIMMIIIIYYTHINYISVYITLLCSSVVFIYQG